MNKSFFATNLFRSLAIIALSVPMVLGGYTAPSASVIEGGVVGSGLSDQTQINMSADLTNIATIAAAASDQLAFQSDEATLGVSDNSSDPFDARGIRHGRKPRR